MPKSAPTLLPVAGRTSLDAFICNNGQPIGSDTISTDLDIPDVPVPIAMVVIQDVPMLENKLLLRLVPFFEGEANRPFCDFRDFSCGGLFKNLVACLKLRRTVFLAFLELWRTDATTALTVFKPIEESFVGDMDTDNHLVKCVARDPHPVLMGALEQLRQVRLQTIPSRILAKHAIVPLLQTQKVVMHIAKVIKQVTQAFDLRMFSYLIFLRSHCVTSYQSLTPTQWVGRHVALRLRCVCLPTGLIIIPQFGLKVKCFFDALLLSKRAVFPPKPKGLGFQTV